MSMKIHVGTASALTPLERRSSRRREGGQTVAEHRHSRVKIVRSKGISVAEDREVKPDVYLLKKAPG
jgi:hypothetical protein